MSYITCLCLALLGIVWAQNNPPAPVVTDNMPGSGYKAIINGGLEKIVGSFYFITTTDQRGVQVSASLSGFNVTDDNTYTYHIHQFLVPANGDCNSTGEHFDPYHAGAAYPCNPQFQDLCQIGDLSGKHGALHFDGTAGTGSYTFTYFDDFLSTTPNTPAFFGNLSVVVHRKRDGLRLVCGNLALLGSDAVSISGLAESLSISNNSVTYNSPAASLMTSVVATTTMYPSQTTPPPVGTSTVTALQTFSPTSSFTSPTSSVFGTSTGILQKGLATTTIVTKHALMVVWTLMMATFVA